MTITVPDDIQWPEAWVPLADHGDPAACKISKALAHELRRELSGQHVLFGIPVIAIARREDGDDVLFSTTDPSKPLAAVHLTWRGRTEHDSRWPSSMIYESWRDWIERCLIPDGKDYRGDA